MFKFKKIALPRILTREEQNEETKNDFKRLLFIQAVLLVLSLFAFELENRLPFPGSQIIFELAFGIAGIYNNYRMFDMIKNFTTNKLIVRAVLYTLFISVLISLVIGNPVVVLPRHELIELILTSQILSFLSFSTVIYFMIRSVFMDEQRLDYRLWGASCIFLGIGIMFSFLYMITEVLLPGSLDLDIPLSIPTYIHCFDYSFYIMSGVDHYSDNIAVIIKNISVIQATISSLYVVILVGRLLSK